MLCAAKKHYSIITLGIHRNILAPTWVDMGSSPRFRVLDMTVQAIYVGIKQMVPNYRDANKIRTCNRLQCPDANNNISHSTKLVLVESTINHNVCLWGAFSPHTHIPMTCSVGVCLETQYMNMLYGERDYLG